jgi:hypothetical protein
MKLLVFGATGGTGREIDLPFHPGAVLAGKE